MKLRTHTPYKGRYAPYQKNQEEDSLIDESSLLNNPSTPHEQKTSIGKLYPAKKNRWFVLRIGEFFSPVFKRFKDKISRWWRQLSKR